MGHDGACQDEYVELATLISREPYRSSFQRLLRDHPWSRHFMLACKRDAVHTVFSHVGEYLRTVAYSSLVSTTTFERCMLQPMHTWMNKVKETYAMENVVRRHIGNRAQYDISNSEIGRAISENSQQSFDEVNNFCGVSTTVEFVLSQILQHSMEKLLETYGPEPTQIYFSLRLDFHEDESSSHCSSICC